MQHRWSPIPSRPERPGIGAGLAVEKSVAAYYFGDAPGNKTWRSWYVIRADNSPFGFEATDLLRIQASKLEPNAGT